MKKTIDTSLFKTFSEPNSFNSYITNFLKDEKIDDTEFTQIKKLIELAKINGKIYVNKNAGNITEFDLLFKQEDYIFNIEVKGEYTQEFLNQNPLIKNKIFYQITKQTDLLKLISNHNNVRTFLFLDKEDFIYEFINGDLIQKDFNELNFTCEKEEIDFDKLFIDYKNRDIVNLVKTGKYILSTSQENVKNKIFEMIEENKNIAIEGSAGSGKTILASLCAINSELIKYYFITNLNSDFIELSKLIEEKRGKNNWEWNGIKEFKNLSWILNSADSLNKYAIIDEAQRLNERQLNALNDLIKKDKIRIIMFYDMEQSIRKNEEKNQELISEHNIEVLKMKKSIRCRDSLIEIATSYQNYINEILNIKKRNNLALSFIRAFENNDLSFTIYQKNAKYEFVTHINHKTDSSYIDHLLNENNNVKQIHHYNGLDFEKIDFFFKETYLKKEFDKIKLFFHGTSMAYNELASFYTIITRSRGSMRLVFENPSTAEMFFLWIEENINLV